MPTITMNPGHPFPAGTTVEFIPRTLKNEPGGPTTRAGTKHKSEGTNSTAVVAVSGALVSPNLSSGNYIAYALVDGSPRRVAVTVP